MNQNTKQPGVIISGGNMQNLAVARNIGKYGIPVTLISPGRRDMVRYSRYISKIVTCPYNYQTNSVYIDFLKEFGETLQEKHVIIPTSDVEALALSKHKSELDENYLIPVAEHSIICKMVNKREFYSLLETKSIPHPQTRYPKDINEVYSIGREIPFPFIIKPVYSHVFREHYGDKVLVVNSPQELEEAINRLKSTNMSVIIQDVIPGNDIYMLYTYFNKESHAVATCGIDKIRQYPPDYGSGTLCKTKWKSEPIEVSLDFLGEIGYYGLAEVELKKDPRDGKYKLIEINPRTSMENALPARSGVNIDYIAYRDITGQKIPDIPSQRDGVIWLDEIRDIKSCFVQWRHGKLSASEILRSYRGPKVCSRGSWSDPLPILIALLQAGYSGLTRLFKRNKQYL